MFINSNDFVGSILLAGFNFAPQGYAFCNGQTLAINSNAALFSLIGTYYGGNGTSTFALPNFQGRIPVGVGGSIILGEQGGSDTVAFTTLQIPSHTHTVSNVNLSAQTGVAATQTSPVGGYFAPNTGNADRFGPGTDEHMAVTPFSDMTTSGTYATDSTGNGIPFDKRMPFQTISFCIALLGVFPSR